MREFINPGDAGADPLAIENAIFETASQLADLAERREFLDRTFYGNPQGRRAMEELLEMAEAASTYFFEGRIRTAELAREALDELPSRRFLPG